jgi:RNA polymerase sigma-70 factor (ECF subfamily)
MAPGGAQAFPESSWSVIAQARERESPGFQKAWARLCSLYWSPVYTYVRLRWNLSVEDAKDVTQEFFLRLYESDALSRYRRERGHFRTFLLGAVRNLVVDRHRRESAAKRGGGTRRVDLDAVVADSRADEAVRVAEEAFDRDWAMGILKRGLEEVRARLEQEGKGVVFEAYRLAVLEPAGDRPRTRKEVAAALGLTEAQVANYLVDVRAMLRHHLMLQIREYTATAQEAEEEFRALFGA